MYARPVGDGWFRVVLKSPSKSLGRSWSSNALPLSYRCSRAGQGLNLRPLDPCDVCTPRLSGTGVPPSADPGLGTDREVSVRMSIDDRLAQPVGRDFEVAGDRRLHLVVGGVLGDAEPVGGQVERTAVEADVNRAGRCGNHCHDVTLPSRNRTSWSRATPARVSAAISPSVKGRGSDSNRRIGFPMVTSL